MATSAGLRTTACAKLRVQIAEGLSPVLRTDQNESITRPRRSSPSTKTIYRPGVRKQEAVQVRRLFLPSFREPGGHPRSLRVQVEVKVAVRTGLAVVRHKLRADASLSAKAHELAHFKAAVYAEHHGAGRFRVPRLRESPSRSADGPKSLYKKWGYTAGVFPG